MFNRKRAVILSCMLTICCILLLCGCSVKELAEKNMSAEGVTYSARYAQSPHQYTNFLNKEIEAVTNQLSTQMLLAESVEKGNYNIEEAVLSAEDSIQIIQECIDNVDTMRPPVDYEENRESVLRLMENGKNTVEDYRDALLNGDSPEGYAKKMQADFIAITAEFNAAWE